eukprot:4051453-Prorocentrum_lima.AAC.1
MSVFATLPLVACKPSMLLVQGEPLVSREKARLLQHGPEHSDQLTACTSPMTFFSSVLVATMVWIR